MELSSVLESLHFLSSPDLVLKREKQFGIINSNGLGIPHKELNQIAKEIGSDESLALALFDSGIYEAKLLCSKCFPPAKLTLSLADKWVKHFTNWEICDSFCQNVFSKSELSLELINKWKNSSEEFEKRACFAIMASYSYANKKIENEIFTSFFSVIEPAITDERLYVKKAVNWAIRSIGKRNPDLLVIATSFCYKMQEKHPANKATSWIVKDALREFEKENLNIMDYPRAIYRPLN